MFVQEFFYKILFDKFEELKYLEFILRQDFINDIKITFYVFLNLTRFWPISNLFICCTLTEL